jgi:light-regulated signal transduction histidine kinase (bacteriophytochrome)
VGKRVVKKYIGRGLVAEIAARKDAEVRDRRRRAEAEVTHLATTLKDADDMLDELNSGIDMLVAAELVAAGFHSHGKTWRKKREQSTRKRM